MRRTADEPLFNSLMEHYHYLGYEQPVGEHLKYVCWAQGRPIACLAWSSAPRHLGSRDRYIGWNAEARRRNIRFIAYNTRFLILPWVRVPHLASHILGKVTRALSDDWERMYGHPIYFAETFIDPGRFRGTCYRAANWQLLGLTTGRGKNDQTNKPNRPIKEILGLPLDAAFPRVTQPVMKTTTPPAHRRESGRTGPDHRSRHARAAERIRRPEAESGAAYSGRTRRSPGGGQRRKPARCCRRLPVLSRPQRRQSRRESASRTGHGRNGAAAFTGARTVRGRNTHTLHPGDICPECGVGKVYRQKEPATLVRIVGQRAAGGDRVRDGATALQRLRGGVHRGRTGRQRARKSTTRRRWR